MVRKTLASTYDGETTAVGFDGKGVYVSCYHGNRDIDGTYRATYSKNGEINKTSKVKTSGKPPGWIMGIEPWAIHVAVSNVYMAGYANMVNVEQVPIYWNNKF